MQLSFQLLNSSNPTASGDDLITQLSAYYLADDEVPANLSRFNSLTVSENANESEDARSNAQDSENEENAGRRARLRRLRRRTKSRAYEFTGGSDVVGILFLDICKLTELPPERNSKLLGSWSIC